MKARIIPFILIAFDVITGLLSAWANQKLSSSAMRKGLINKLAEIISIALGYFVDEAQAVLALGINVPMFASVSVYICVMELVSVMENLGNLNPELFQFFRPYLRKLNGTETDEERKEW